MKTPILFAAALACAAPVWAQPAPAEVDALTAPGRFPVPFATDEQARRVLAPPDISIHAREQPLLAVLRELERQSGRQIDVAGLPDKAMDIVISVDLKTSSFQRAFAEIMDEANLHFSLSHRGTGYPWKIADPAPKTEPSVVQSVNGLTVVQMMSLYSKSVKSLSSPAENVLYVLLRLTPDERLPLVGQPRSLATLALDDQGRSLLREDNAYRPQSDFTGSSDLWLSGGNDLSLRLPQPDARKIARLEGVMLYLAVAQRAHWEVADVFEAPGLTYDFKNGERDVHVSIEKVERAGDNVRMVLQMKPAVFDSNGRDWNDYENPLFAYYNIVSWMRVEDANGVRLLFKPTTGQSPATRAKTDVTFFPPPLPGSQAVKLALPLKFSFEPPTQWMQIPVPFRFKDVPLP